MEWIKRHGGCIFDELTFWCAVSSGNEFALLWLKLNYCPWGDLVTKDACDMADHLVPWLKRNGCPT